jgi:hypothetical protein
MLTDTLSGLTKEEVKRLGYTLTDRNGVRFDGIQNRRLNEFVVGPPKLHPGINRPNPFVDNPD